MLLAKSGDDGRIVATEILSILPEFIDNFSNGISNMVFNLSQRVISIATVCSIIALTGCGGREAHPISATNPSDSQFNCAGITREFNANERTILAVTKEKGNANAKNAVLGITGAVLFFPALFFMDPKSPERVEIEALRNRNQVLGDIARSKGCSQPKSTLDQFYKELHQSSISKVKD